VAESSRSTIVVWAIAAVLAVVAGARLLGDESAPAPIRVSDGAAPTGAESAPGGTRAGRAIYVHVAGAVRLPGLLELAPGSRVADALKRAGGAMPRADLTAVNLAAPLQDGQQVVVPGAGAGGAGASGAGAGAAGVGAAVTGGAGGLVTGKVHLSTATVEQLDTVDGIGPTLAQRIIEYRDAHGGFRSLAELAQVDGIGEKRLATLREALQP
jgi:competence protein ComEA